METTVADEPKVTPAETATAPAVAEAPAEPPQAAESTLGSEILSGLLGAGIAMACLLLPIIHLVAAPLGPFIGGFVASNRSNPGARGRAIIALTIGTSMSATIAIVAHVFVALAGRSQLPTWFPSQGTLTAIVCGVWVYATTLGTIGGVVSNAFARRERSSS